MKTTSRAPSTETLMNEFEDHLTRHEIDIIRLLMKGELNPLHFRGAKLADIQSHSQHDEKYLIMLAIDTVYDTHGVGHLDGRDADGHLQTKSGNSFDYCNTGDSYCVTIIYTEATDTFSVGCWADKVK